MDPSRRGCIRSCQLGPWVRVIPSDKQREGSECSLTRSCAGGFLLSPTPTLLTPVVWRGLTVFSDPSEVAQHLSPGHPGAQTSPVSQDRASGKGTRGGPHFLVLLHRPGRGRATEPWDGPGGHRKGQAWGGRPLQLPGLQFPKELLWAIHCLFYVWPTGGVPPHLRAGTHGGGGVARAPVLGCREEPHPEDKGACRPLREGAGRPESCWQG